MKKIGRKRLEGMCNAYTGTAKIEFNGREIAYLILPSNDKKSNVKFIEDMVESYRGELNKQIENEDCLPALFKEYTENF
jgi:hypothetical protein